MNDLHHSLLYFAKSARAALTAIAIVVSGLPAVLANKNSLVLEPGKTLELDFADPGLPPTLYSMMNGTTVAPRVTVHLPEDYSPTKTFPLVLYVPGNDGGLAGNIRNAETIAPPGWIAATLPLFKQSVDRSEPAGGMIANFGDYAVLSQAYRTLLGRLFETVPNIDGGHSAMVGFSNGAITIGVLLSHHDEFTLTHFRRFCLVDNGMFHLGDLHRSRSRHAQFLLLVGDQPGLGREVKIRQAQLQQDAWRLLGIDVSARVMANTGHEFNEPQREIVRTWLKDEPARKQPPQDGDTGINPP